MTRALENPKNLHFNRLLLTKKKYIKKKKYRRVMFDGTEVDAKSEGNWFGLSENFRFTAEK